MVPLGKLLIAAGLVLVVVGACLVWLGPRAGAGGWLPGDLVVRRGGMTFIFPVVTCLVLSVVLTLLFRIFSR